VSRRHDDPMALADSLGAVVRALRNDTTPGSGAGAGVMGGVFGRWEEAVGAAVALHVQPVKLDGTTLVVEVDDPAWATQLRFFEATLKARLAEVAGAVIETVDVRVRRH
jgi:predicted nucleic acid-binding Zn ribbon protein